MILRLESETVDSGSYVNICLFLLCHGGMDLDMLENRHASPLGHSYRFAYYVCGYVKKIDKNCVFLLINVTVISSDLLPMIICLVYTIVGIIWFY